MALKRVLAIDDDPELLAAYRHIFTPKVNSAAQGIAKLSAIFDGLDDEEETQAATSEFEIVCADKGEEGVKRLEEAVSVQNPFQVAIVDMRMPMGIDGLETARRLRAIDPDIQVLIVTAYTDKSPEEIRNSLKDGLYYLRKPFDSTEVYQLVFSLADNYRNINALKTLNQNLDAKVKEEVEKNIAKDKQLVRQSKLAAMGEMMSSIAHQWRQPLNTIGLLIQEISYRCGSSLKPDEQTWLKEATTDAMKEITQLSTTIDNCRNLYKTEDILRVFAVDLKIKDVLEILQKRFEDANIQLAVELQAYDLTSYANEFTQAFASIATNAIEAIVRTKPNAPFIKIVSKKVNDFATVEVIDNGGGIDKEIGDRIFEPYFSTKHASQDVGLGLYIARQMVEENMGGTLTFENIDGGAKFAIKIPEHPKDAIR